MMHSLKRRMLAMTVISVFAAVFALGLFETQSVEAASHAKPYISDQNVVTNVGQPFHVVITYGNKGGSTLYNVEYGCYYVNYDGSAVVDGLSYDTYRNPLIAGQNANLEFTGHAYFVSNATKYQCYIAGNDGSPDGPFIFDFSPVRTIKVHQ